MEEDKDYILDIRSNLRITESKGDFSDKVDAESANSDKPASAKSARPYICVHFECCGVYARIYRNKSATAYEGWCPKCCRKVTVKIGPNGTTSRFFRAF